MWSCAWSHSSISMLLKKSHVFITESCDSLSSSICLNPHLPSHFRFMDQARRRQSQWILRTSEWVQAGFLWVYNLCLCVYGQHVEMSKEESGDGWVGWGGGSSCIWTLGSELISLSHPQPNPASLRVPINNKSLWLPRASCLKSQSSMKWPLLNYWDGHI